MNTDDDELIGPLIDEWEYQQREVRNAWRGLRGAIIKAVTPWMERINEAARRLTNT